MGIEKKYEEKTILVTGGAGCIGTNLCRKLAESGARKVIILDDLSGAYEWNIPKAKNIVFVKPDYVFHLAVHFANQRWNGWREDCRNACTGWDVIENPDNFNRGLEEIPAQQTAPVREVFIQKTRCYGIEHKRLVERKKY